MLLQTLQYTEAAVYCQFNCQQLLICACKAFQAVTSVTTQPPATAGLERLRGQVQGLNAPDRQQSGLSAASKSGRWASTRTASQQSTAQGRGLFAASGQGRAAQSGPAAAGQAAALTGLLEAALKLVMVFSQTGWLTRLEGQVKDQERFAHLFRDLQQLAELVSHYKVPVWC